MQYVRSHIQQSLGKETAVSKLSEFLLSSYGGKFANILSPISKREKSIPGTHSLRKKGKEIKAWMTARISQKIPFAFADRDKEASF